MFLNLCEMSWTMLTVLSLSLPVWTAVKVTQPYRVVSTNGTAQIQCVIQPHSPFHQIQPTHDQHVPRPSPDLEDFQVSLQKGLHNNQQLCSSTFNFKELKETRSDNGQVQCMARARGGTVDVTISGLKASDTDLYRCVIQMFYPPPYLRLTGNGTLLHVIESSGCPAQEAQRKHMKEGESGALSSVPVVILVIVIICVLITIIYFQTVQHERGRSKVIRKSPARLPHKNSVVLFPYENMA